jgi:hypothetical protein
LATSLGDNVRLPKLFGDNVQYLKLLFEWCW